MHEMEHAQAGRGSARAGDLAAESKTLTTTKYGSGDDLHVGPSSGELVQRRTVCLAIRVHLQPERTQHRHRDLDMRAQPKALQRAVLERCHTEFGALAALEVGLKQER